MYRSIPIQRDTAIITTKMFSSFVARNEYSETGVSLYDKLHITEQDIDFLKEAIDDFVLIIAKMCSEYLVDTTHNSVNVETPIEFTEGLYETFCKMVNEAVENYVFSKWLEYNKMQEAQTYFAAFTTLLTGAETILYTRRMAEIPQKKLMKKRTVIIYRKDVEFDMAAITDRLFLARSGDNTVKNQLRYESTPTNLALLARYLRTYKGKVNNILRPYLRERGEPYIDRKENKPLHITGTDEATYESYRDLQNDLIFDCYFPENWDDNQFELLGEGIYNYILNMCIVEFLKVSPVEIGVYVDSANEGWNNIGKAITARIHLQHRGRFPYDTL